MTCGQNYKSARLNQIANNRATIRNITLITILLFTVITSSTIADAILIRVQQTPGTIITTPIYKPKTGPPCRAILDIIDIKYSGKQAPKAISNKDACAGRQIPARYLISSRIKKDAIASDSAFSNTDDSDCKRTYPVGKELELTILLPTRGPASQLQDRQIIQGTIQLGDDECEKGIYLTDYKIMSREELSRLTQNTQALSSIPAPGKLLESSTYKRCKKHPRPSCPGGRVIPGKQGRDGCYGPSICVYPKLQGTCKNKCGWKAGSGQCKCDIECTKRGDCCTDYNPQCLPLVCPTVRDPVCGEDEKTYNNACFAQKAAVNPECRGECPCTRNCPIYKEPPCLEGTIIPGKKMPNGCSGPPVCKMNRNVN